MNIAKPNLVVFAKKTRAKVQLHYDVFYYDKILKNLVEI